MATPPDVFNPRKFWTALLSSMMTPYFIVPGDGPRLCGIPGDGFTRQQKKMLCGCPTCLTRKGLHLVDWLDPETGTRHQLAIPDRFGFAS